MRTTGDRDGFVDGGWWPHSTDLTTELPALVGALREAGHDVFRVVYHLGSWDPAPRLLVIGGRTVKLGGFHSQDPALITLVDTSGWRRLDVVVVPPDAEPAFAEQALAMAGLDGDEHHAAQVLTRDEPVPTG